MPVREVDFILNHILDNYPKVSDINVSVGRPFQVEVDGELIELFLNKKSGRLSPKKAMEGAHRWGCKSEMTVR